MTGPTPEAAATSPDVPRRWHARIFSITWLSYFSYYFARKPFSATKSDIAKEFALSKSDLNWIDSTYNVGYCLGMFVNGPIIDRIGPRRWVALGMLVTSALAIKFALLDRFVGVVLGMYMLVWGLNGLVQSSGWPGNSKVAATWWGTERRARVMGWWSTCYQAGGLAATWVASRFLAHSGWRAAFIGPAIWVAVVGVAFYLLVRDRPSDVGFRDPDTVPDEDPAVRLALMREARARILRTPMVWAMGGAYFGCKVIRYAFLFWLPYYLATALDYGKVQSNDMSIAFEAGGIVFVILAGQLADRVFGRRRVATAFGALLGLAGALWLYREVGDRSEGANVAVLLLVGGFLFAADSLISGAVTQDMSGPHAAAMAAGLVNGIGSIGQVLQGFLLVWITDTYGWNPLFTIFIGMALFGALCCLPYVRVRPQPVPDVPAARVV